MIATLKSTESILIIKVTAWPEDRNDFTGTVIRTNMESFPINHKSSSWNKDRFKLNRESSVLIPLLL